MSDFSMKALKGGIREYINILISIYYMYNVLENIKSLELLYKKIDSIDNYDELDKIKLSIIDIQDSTPIDIMNRVIKETTFINNSLSTREKDLIKRGYKKEDVIKLCSYSHNQLERTADIILSIISKNCRTVSNPVCFFVGGQPGCGKSTNALKLRESFQKDGAVEICIDNYRAYHPNYLMMEKTIKEHWKNRLITDNDSPGNDIADFTHHFASEMTDYLVDKLINNDEKYNLIIEWGMRTPNEPLRIMKSLKDKGYNNNVDFVIVDEKSSYEACVLRADVMDGLEHIVRRIPKYFHDLCVKTLPDSCNQIYEDGFVKNKIINNFNLISRDGKILWDKSNKGSPIEVYKTNLYKEKI